MTANFLKYFYTNDYDDFELIKWQNRRYSVGDLKPIILDRIAIFKSLAEKNVTFATSDNFEFFVNFLACVFAEKEITLKPCADDVLGCEKCDVGQKCLENFDKINTDNVIINLFTSGSSGENKCVKKSLTNLIDEAFDLIDEIDLKDAKTVISTTNFNFLFGLTFYLMLPLNAGMCIDLDRISYPEEITGKNLLFITTPSFLEKMSKYQEKPPVKLEKIITAGAKLKRDEFKFALEISKSVTEIYGCTESGVIAHREHYQDKLKLFRNVEISEGAQTLVKTNYSCEKTQISGDSIKVLANREIELDGRLDRVLKIQEQRISAEEIENYLATNNFVKEAYCFETDGKVAPLVALSELGYDFVFKNDITKIKKELKAYLHERFNVIPQKFKFIDEIPRTERGKVDKARIFEIFKINMSYPLIVNREIDADCAQFEVYFYRHCNFFKGHFENFPILAGVVQLLFAQILAKSSFGVNCGAGQIRKVKFKNIIEPDKIIKLKIKRSENYVEFSYFDDEKMYSSGILPIKNVFRGEL